MQKTSVKTFRDLIAWQKAMKLARRVYRVTRNMPTDERFGLRMQMRRSAVSVPSNIAEGHARRSRADYTKHLRMARGSLAELATQLELSMDIEMIPVDVQVNELLAETDRVLQGLIRSMEAKLTSSET